MLLGCAQAFTAKHLGGVQREQLCPCLAVGWFVPQRGGNG